MQLIPCGKGSNHHHVFSCPFRESRVLVTFEGCPARAFRGVFYHDVRIANTAVVAGPLPVFRRLIFLHQDRQDRVQRPFNGARGVIRPLYRPYLLGSCLKCPSSVEIKELPPKRLPFVCPVPIARRATNFWFIFCLQRAILFYLFGAYGWLVATGVRDSGRLWKGFFLGV